MAKATKATFFLAFCLAVDVTPAKLGAALEEIAGLVGEPSLAEYAQVPAVLDFYVNKAEGPSAAVIEMAADAANIAAAPPADVTAVNAIEAQYPIFSFPPKGQQLFDGIEGFLDLDPEAAKIFSSAGGM